MSVTPAKKKYNLDERIQRYAVISLNKLAI